MIHALEVSADIGAWFDDWAGSCFEENIMGMPSATTTRLSDKSSDIRTITDILRDELEGGISNRQESEARTGKFS